MKLTSPEFSNKTMIPAKFTCDGEDINPPLSIEDIPAGTQSLVLIVDDPDASSGTWTHWIVWNIDPSVTEIGENEVPNGAAQGTTSFGSKGYGGPCPPTGTHSYFFKLYALDTVLDPEIDMDAKKLEYEMKTHTLAQTELVGLYARKR